jgi:Fic family protein
MFIHELPGWPGLTWDAGVLANGLGRVRHRQGRLLGRMEALGFDLRDEANVLVLTRDVVESSAIEGEHLDATDVRSSIARRLGLPLAGLPSTPSQRVEGIVEVLLDATQRAREGLTQERLWGWHAALFPTGFSGMRRITVGDWRPPEAGPMQVVSGPVGRERLHFEAPAAERLSTEMGEFLAWFESSTRAAEELDPVLVAAIAHLWFITIHPFEDGNGRIGRAIADMALARADGIPQRFYSLSSQLMTERKDYYRELEAAQRGGLDITNWLTWFLGCLDRAIDRSDDLVAGVLRRARVWRRAEEAPGVNARQRIVLERLLGDFKGHLTSSKYATFAKCSSDTALRDIENLVERGLLVRNPSGGRSTSYRLADAGSQS